MSGGIIGSYWVRLYSGRDGREDLRAHIILLDPTERQNGLIAFYADGVALPAPGPVPPRPSTSYPTMHLPFSAFAEVMDLLRNEKPLIYSWDRFGPFLTTQYEPQGEGES